MDFMEFFLDTKQVTNPEDRATLLKDAERMLAKGWTPREIQACLSHREEAGCKDEELACAAMDAITNSVAERLGKPVRAIM